MLAERAALKADRTAAKPATRGAVRPGGRTERVRKAVLGAVLQRLEAGDLDFNFQEVARASGVHVATIYARWPERASLVMAAYEEHVLKLEVALTGDWEADFHRTGIALRDFLNDPVEITTNKLLITAGDDAYRQQMVKRFTPVVAELARPLEIARQAGGIRSDADPELIVGMLIAEILMLIMFVGTIPDDEFIYRIVDYLIRASRS
jgi:AcrR family transcriptional regulator